MYSVFQDQHAVERTFETEMVTAIRRLPKGESPGTDGITSEMRQTSADTAGSYLTVLVRRFGI